MERFGVIHWSYIAMLQKGGTQTGKEGERGQDHVLTKALSLKFGYDDGFYDPSQILEGV